MGVSSLSVGPGIELRLSDFVASVFTAEQSPQPGKAVFVVLSA